MVINLTSTSQYREPTRIISRAFEDATVNSRDPAGIYVALSLKDKEILFD